MQSLFYAQSTVENKKKTNKWIYIFVLHLISGLANFYTEYSKETNMFK